ncbi:MAG: pyridine nucleotide-disulfide oxidoreductase [Candidatus Tectimicrobiota bacterium]|nr:MAG: pyridine nucleotide-disulfide oxidoreductase [Candidatus Tectomicrobia bacterium]
MLLPGARRRQALARAAELALQAGFALAARRRTAPVRTAARFVIVGGGTAGLTVAARLCRALEAPRLTLIEPSCRHLYQPGQTLVAAGLFAKAHFVRPQRHYLPRAVTWLQDRAVLIDPERQVVVTGNGTPVPYDFLVVATGVELHPEQLPGLEGHLGRDGLCTIYTPEQAEQTWHMLSSFQGGTALFTQPATPIKCGGAPQKIMYLAADLFRRHGVHRRTQVIFATPGERLFGIDAYARTLAGVAARKGVVCAFRHRLVEVRAAQRQAVFAVADEHHPTSERHEVLSYDLLHLVPPMSPPAAVQQSPLAHASGPQQGWLQVDRHTLQHPRYANVFALGDVIDAPGTKTGAAVRKQAPVLVHNLLATLQGQDASRFRRYHGYTSCPLITGYGRVMLAEFDYDLRPLSTFPWDPARPRRSMWLLKLYLLPALYWHGMLRGLA